MRMDKNGTHSDAYRQLNVQNATKQYNIITRSSGSIKASNLD